MRTIWKFTLPIQDEVVLSMPMGANILSVQAQAGTGYTAQVWAMVETDAPTEQRFFLVVGTGDRMPNPIHGHLEFLGSVLLSGDRLVFHVFEAVPGNMRRNLP